jgi:hypothetical protein
MQGTAITRRPGSIANSPHLRRTVNTLRRVRDTSEIFRVVALQQISERWL